MTSGIEDDIAQLRREADAAGKAKARADAEAAAAEGRQEAALAALKEEFGVETIGEAQAKAARLEAALRAEAARVRQHLAQAGAQA